MTPLARAEQLFAALAEMSADPPGVTRASFGPGENAAHAIIRREAVSLGFETCTDEIGHLYVTLPGSDRTLPVLMTGSHLDSVPHGGNFDGAAGVLAGLVLLERLAGGGPPPCDVTLMAIRAEEMIWFPEHYLGSRAAFGLLPRDTPDRLRRSDSDRTLANHMTEAGFDAQAIREGRPQLDPARIGAFLETHIEQGPVLVEAGCPVGIVRAIRGNIRHRYCRIDGETTHAGGVPRQSRRDAVLAGVELVSALEAHWLEVEESGKDMVLTLGEFSTDPTTHGITKVPGRLTFTIDVRSQDDAVLDRFEQDLQTRAAEIAQKRGVHIDLGHHTQAVAAPMSTEIQQSLRAAAQSCGVPHMDLASGGGHDCATFASQGIPSGMLFIRNRNGSHNPDEHMDFEDFAAACDVLFAWARDYLSRLRTDLPAPD
ncbi:hydantoinase/carbamoylase family amidase [Roseobacter sinensis]|uniref:Hydantoinase/carbamoylase family amidase n=1 Tax=Roseobacter sinensis TaxID=2931391 RepID=A0ABT3BIR3_9RHOB|nr:hydantoinase/carbamoylase family amidase [Roseobacter sp. WL0113]MCV3273460.1 hydantoinase/carbamoylase family amidase [Roseobacter sp. WL0113]